MGDSPGISNEVVLHKDSSSAVGDAIPPLGISLYALLPLSHYLQDRAKDRGDPRVHVSKIELARQFRPDLVSKYWGLPTSEAELTSLGLDKVQSIAKALFLRADAAQEDCVQAWVSALRAPVQTTAEVCQFIVKQDTAPHAAADKAPVSCSYVEFLQTQATSCDDSGRALWGPASHFVSHAWSYKWEDLVLALSDFYHGMVQHEREKCYFWIDIFCVDQHKAAAGYYGSAFWEEKFQSMVRSIGHTVCIIMPWHRPVCMTRIWCLWEIFSTVVNDVKLSVAMTEAEGESLQNATFTSFDDTIASFLAIDAANAEATDPIDKKVIGGKIEVSGGGYERLNDVVKTALLARFVAYISYIGNTARLQQMVQDYPLLSIETPVDIQSAKNRAYTPLQHAARNGHGDTVRFLLQRGASVDTFEIFSGMNALHLAVLAGHFEAASTLVQDGHADPFDNGMCALGLSPAHIAAEFGRLEILTYFISSSKTPENALHACGRGGESLLYCCVDVSSYVGPPQGLYGELARRASTSGSNDWNEGEIIEDRSRTARYLRQCGVTLYGPGQELGTACRLGDYRRVEEMLTSSSDLRLQINTPFKCNKEYGSLVFSAAMHLVNLATTISEDHVKVLDILLNYGADPTLLPYRKLYDHACNLRVLTRSPSADYDGYNMLHRMTRYSSSLRENYASAEPSMQLHDGAQVAMARLLLNKGGLDIEARHKSNGEGMTALHFASMGRKPELVKYLVEEGGADVNARVVGGINDGMTALGLAEHGDFAMGPTQSARKNAVVDFLRTIGAAGGRNIIDGEGDSGGFVQTISLDNFVDMGFDRDAATAALEAAGGDVAEAMNRLLGGDSS